MSSTPMTATRADVADVESQHSAKLPGLNLFSRARVGDLHKFDQAFRLACDLRAGNNNWSFHKRLQKFAEVTEMLLKLVVRQRELIDGYEAELNQMSGAAGERSRKRWTPQEDEALVTMACRDGETLVTLALAFNRTAAAVSSRLTYLVGVSRVNRAVAGRLIGYLDGEPVDGHFQGRLTDVVRVKDAEQ